MVSLFPKGCAHYFPCCSIASCLETVYYITQVVWDLTGDEEHAMDVVGHQLDVQQADFGIMGRNFFPTAEHALTQEAWANPGIGMIVIGAAEFSEHRLATLHCHCYHINAAAVVVVPGVAPLH